MPKARHEAEGARREARLEKQARKDARRVLRLARRRVAMTPTERNP
jgi:hypothetical protein